MLLNDIQIATLCAGDRPMISPFEPTKVKPQESKVISYGLSSVGYDMRLSNAEVWLFNRVPAEVIDPKRSDFTCLEQADLLYGEDGERFFYLPGHSYALGVSYEKFQMPNDVMAQCIGKSTYARWGLIVNVTPLEPGWCGHLTIEISNSSPADMRVYVGEGIAQLLFFKHELPMHTYGDRSGKYRSQGHNVVLGKV